MSDLDSIVTRMREDHLSDPSGTLFLTARCLRWANDAHREVLRKHRQFRGLRAMTEIEEVTIAANDETCNLAGLVRPYRELRSVWLIPATGEPIPLEPIPDGEEETFRAGGNSGIVPPDVVPRYYLQCEGNATYFHALPLSTGARTYRFYYEYGVVDLAGNATLSTPPDYDDLVAALGARRAWRSKQQSDEALEAFIAGRWLDFEEEYTQAAATSRPARVRDDVEVFR